LHEVDRDATEFQDADLAQAERDGASCGDEDVPAAA
jgi:hypothetical protein